MQRYEDSVYLIIRECCIDWFGVSNLMCFFGVVSYFVYGQFEYDFFYLRKNCVDAFEFRKFGHLFLLAKISL